MIDLNNWDGETSNPKKRKKRRKSSHKDDEPENPNGPNNENMVQVAIEKAYSGDGLLITIDKLKGNKPTAPTLFKLFPRKEELLMPKNLNIKNQGLIEINFSLKSFGVSFNDEKPREVFYFSVDNLRSMVQLNSKNKKLMNCFLEVSDLQGDYQISKS